MERLRLDKDLETVKNQNREVFITEVQVNEEELNEIFIDILHNKANIERMFMEEIPDEEELKHYISHYIPDEAQDMNECEIEKFVEEAVERNKTFYSELAEGFVALLAPRFLNSQPIHALMSDKATLIDTHSGVDGVLYDEEKQKLFFVEAKFFNDLSAGKNAVIHSLTQNAKNKYESFKRNAIKQLAIIYDKSKYKVRTVDALNLEITFVGFVLHGNFREIKPFEYAEKIEDYVKNNFKVDQPNYNFILFHLNINDKQKTIFEIINKSIEKIKE